VLEAYTNLLRVWSDATLEARLHELIRIFLDHIIDGQNHHFRLFFDEEWRPKSNVISFGHDIEGSWLLCEAAEVLGDEAVLAAVRGESIKMAQAVLKEAVDADGGLLYEADRTGIIDTDKHWWPQAEAVVGFLNANQISGRAEFLRAAERSWEFIEKFIVDRKNGEWFWKVSREGVASEDKYKVDPWKCPYHNSRMCFEVMARVDKMRETELQASAK
jgi:mannobiose 2-epimerase